MKFICLGYIEPGKFESMPDAERNAAIDACFAYDDELRRKGHFAGGDGLMPPGMAVTLRDRNGKVSATDGPYAETKEILFSFYVVDVEDLDAAIALAARMPATRYGSVQIHATHGFEKA